MEDWKVIVLTSLLSLTSSFIIGYFTNRQSYKNDVNKWLLEKRSAVYFEFYGCIESILKDPYIVFKKAYLEELTKFKPKVKLLGSADTTASFEKFYMFIRTTYMEFYNFCENNDPRKNPANFQQERDDEGEVINESFCGTQQKIDNFEYELKQYKNQNTPEDERVRALLDPLCENLKNDLGNSS